MCQAILFVSNFGILCSASAVLLSFSLSSFVVPSLVLTLTSKGFVDDSLRCTDSFVLSCCIYGTIARSPVLLDFASATAQT